jgi:hypothetical protein
MTKRPVPIVVTLLALTACGSVSTPGMNIDRTDAATPETSTKPSPGDGDAGGTGGTSAIGGVGGSDDAMGGATGMGGAASTDGKAGAAGTNAGHCVVDASHVGNCLLQ